LYAVFPFCGSFLLTALVYDWVEVVQKRKKDKQLIWASIFIVCFVLAAYITYRIGWCSITEITKTFILMFTASFAVHLIYSSYSKKRKRKVV
jgi:CDP-diglyceride synthetase